MPPLHFRIKSNLKSIPVVVFLFAASVGLVLTISRVSPYAVDWHDTYYPATRAFLNGQSPYYEGSLLENPIWLCVILAPMALFPEAIGRALLLLFSLIAYLAVFRQAGLSRTLLILVMFSPQVLYSLNLGTVDALILAAPALPPVAGFLVAILKPQIGIGYALFLIADWIRGKKYKELLAAVLLGAFGLVVSLQQGMPFSGRLIDAPWNTSLFPYSMLVGIPLLIAGLIKKEWRWTIMASPMLSPYLTFHSWAVLFLHNKSRYLVAVFAFSWIIYLAWHFTNIQP